MTLIVIIIIIMIDSFRGGHAAIEEKRILLDASLDLTSQDDKQLKKIQVCTMSCNNLSVMGI